MSFRSACLDWLQGLGIAIGSGFIAFYANISVAQITPDATLPNNSNVILEGNTRIISGGTTRGANLFHSFSEFSVPTGSEALFNNRLDIQNILTRVTGSGVSNIDGSIRALGRANLFIINPNGIIFSKNALLNIGGSFIATSANSMKFADGFEFSATNPQSVPLLTISVPVGLQFGTNPGTIQVQGSTLRLNPGQTLALVGGSVNMNGGRLLTSEGRIELAGVAAGTVGLSNNGSYLGLNFPNSAVRADVSLSNGAEANVRGADKGSIAINARNIDISGENTRVRAGIFIDNGTPQSQAGDIELNATGIVKVRDGSIISDNTIVQGNAGAVRINAEDSVFLDKGSHLESVVGPEAVGNSGGIIINTGSLFVTNFASVNTVTQGLGNAGNVNINARNTISLDGESFVKSSVSGNGNGGKGNGGDVNITTGSLSLTQGSTLFSGVYGLGNAGSININARDTITVEGESSPNQTSGIRSNVFEGSEGNGGNININTGSLFVKNGAVLNTNIQSIKGKLAGNININARDTVSFDGIGTNQPAAALSSNSSLEGVVGGDINITTRSLQVKNNAQLNAQTQGQGNGGNITVNTDTIDVVNGGALITTSSSSGKAGNITVKAVDSVNLSGKGITYLSRVDKTDGTYYLNQATPDTGLFANTETTSTGQGGNIRITTGKLTIQDSAQTSVNSLGTGNAGSIEAIARSIRLDAQGKITANTTAGQGNIGLRSRDLIVRRNSNITTNASGQNVIGGNININADILAAFENSDITANSDDFRGGNIIINTKGIFGIAPLSRQELERLHPKDLDPRQLQTSDITATGATRQLSGNVQITRPDVDPTNGLIEIPLNLIDASSQISTACTPGTRQFQNTFVATGRGGLPMSPAEPLQDSSTVSAWVRLRPNAENLANTMPVPEPTAVSTTPIAATIPIVEASGWVIDRKGNIELVAQVPQLNPHSPWQTPASCPVSQGGVKYGKISAAKASN
ncbi:filamentous hemagglutinin N-terminal domain-containing protein [Nostoc sp. DedSLP04]|uniref:two-partner secretion domain-containing protein n=1 Tax=Nostoc sp. DedSLP04 TaxID=3075401 RepID=UPI002AD40237|nr:filamentous hemagglutinin N-terminal domain-containing protein [Nostoc sp. DedSLP04]MDZ8032662.1 filamentous hemagglutinin N-terminal domain-containing protein [Nostoc sp. DedSLP04]